MSKETGGYAFPIPNADYQTFQPSTIEEYKRIQSGMTLRDYFAAQALSTTAGYHAEDVATWSADDFAMHAYNVADAMLKYRNK